MSEKIIQIKQGENSLYPEIPEEAVIGLTEDLDRKANIDGYYEQMTVGSALALAGQTQRTNDAMYRKSGGSEEVTSGVATIAKIQGQTKAWNQISSIKSYSTATTGLTDTNSVFRYHLFGLSNVATSIFVVREYALSEENFWEKNIVQIPSDIVTLRQKHNGSTMDITFNITNVLPNHKVLVASYFKKVNVQDAGSFIVDNMQIIDLTLIYGDGNEPTTPEQFEADYFKWFGKPLTYEEYNAGSLRSVQLESLKTTGFNQWDEEWEVGDISISDGTNETSTDRIRSKNYIKVIPGETLFLNIPNGQIMLFTYDSDKKFIAKGQATGMTASDFVYSSITGVVPQGVNYIRFKTSSSYGTTYNHDICINISNPAKNGTYEPYEEEHVAPIPVTTLKGKLNGQGESVVIFPDGMKSAGTIADEIYTVGDKTYAVQRVGAVDLGSLNWSVSNPESHVFREPIANINNMKPSEGTMVYPNALSPIYTAKTWQDLAATDNMCFAIADAANNNMSWVNSSYSDVATFKSAMQGVMLYYELNEPLVYEVEGFTLPKNYLVDSGGTEEQVQKANVQGLAAILTCIYGVDAVAILDKLPRNYISEASMDNFLAKLNIATNGVWTKSFNESSGEWDFNYQPSAQTNANTNEESI